VKKEITKQIIVLIKNEVPLLSVVSQFGLSAKKNGGNYFIHCPFHGERTASLSINDKKNLWKCFGCNEGGDQITFAQLMLGSGKRRFHETILWFVDNFNLTSPEAFALLSQQEDEDRSGSDAEGKHYYQTRSPEEIQRERILDSDLRAKITLLCDSDYIEDFDRTYQTLLDYFDLEEEESEDLENRGCNLDWAYRNLYRSLPVSRARRIEVAEEIAGNLKFAEEDTEYMPPGFFRISGGKEKGKLCVGGDRFGLRLFQMDKSDKGWRKSFAPQGAVLPIHGLLIPHRNREGKIISLKIRNQSFPGLRLADLLTWRGEKSVQKAEMSVAAAGALPPPAPEEPDIPALRLNLPFRVNKLSTDKQELFYEYQNNWVPKYLFVSGYGQRALTGAHFGNYERWRDVYQRRAKSMHWIVTEGELKADIISERLETPCLGLPGVTGNHFELFWEMNAFGHLDAPPEQVGDILDQALLDWDNWESERETWLEYKRTHYSDAIKTIVEREVMSRINELSGKQIEMMHEKTLLLHRTDPADRDLLFDYFKAPFNKSALTDTIFLALDEDDNISVNRALHRLGWMALKLGISPLRIRWRNAEGKGFDDLLKNDGDWWVERLADNL
jgi:CHC2 zinc finger